MEEIKRLGGKVLMARFRLGARPTPHDISCSLRSSKHPEVLNLLLTARDTFLQPRAGEPRCALRRRSLSEHLRGSRRYFVQPRNAKSFTSKGRCCCRARTTRWTWFCWKSEFTICSTDVLLASLLLRPPAPAPRALPLQPSPPRPWPFLPQAFLPRPFLPPPPRLQDLPRIPAVFRR